MNKATLEDLDSLPGIGPVLAQRILDQRDKQPFSQIEDLRKVPGIGAKKFDAIKELVFVDAP